MRNQLIGLFPIFFTYSLGKRTYTHRLYGKHVIGLLLVVGAVTRQEPAFTIPLLALSQASLNSFSSDEVDLANPTEEAKPKGLIYIRVSTDEQAEDGSGVQRQENRTENVAEKEGIDVVGDPITDKGDSGRNFERTGLQELLQRAQQEEITYIIVEDTDRLGRRAPQTLSMIDLIQNECNATVVTPQGAMDTTRIDGLAMAALQSIISDIENRNRSTRLLSGQMDAFRQKDWKAWFNKPPFGYDRKGDWSAEDPDERWIQIDPTQEKVVEEIFDYFLHSVNLAEPYAKVDNHLQDEFDLDLPRWQIKRILQNPVYAGKPTVEGETIGDEGQKEVVEDKSLKIIDEDWLRQAQDKVENVRKEYANNSDSDTLDLEALLAQYGVQVLTSVSDCVALLCPTNDCDGRMRKNGTRKLTQDAGIAQEEDVHNWQCRECGKQKKFPNEWEMYQIQHKTSDDGE
ncbi:recombinase family protein [Salinigranum sp. GCM10025319]|uniref:recombinase family protein n=1 Tax=Salinigranum sp. GCM10025319 TaxID=3252687 RepID=UPI00361EC62B